MSKRSSTLDVIWQQQRGLMLLLLLLLLVFGSLYFATDLLVEPKLTKLRQDKTALQQKIQRQQQLVSTEGVPLSATEQIVKDLEKFHEKIPSKVKLADFIGDLFVWGKRSQLEIEQISYQPKVGSEMGFIEYGLGFSVQGTYGQLKKFIHSLENSQRILVINSIALSGGRDQAEEQNTVALTIRLTTYFRETEQ